MSYTYDFFEKTCNVLKNSGFYPKSILDIGANICQTADIMRKTWPKSKILLIEGDEDCKPYYIVKNYDYLLKLLGKENGIVNFYKTKKIKSCTGNSIYREDSISYRKDNLIVEIKPIFKLDDCVNEHFDLIKLDTQGSELDILMGGVKTIKNSKVLIVEVSIINYNVGGCKKNDVINFIVNLGFDFIEVIEQINNGKEIIQENLLFIKP